MNTKSKIKPAMAALLLSLTAVSTNASAMLHPALSSKTPASELICYMELDRSGNPLRICATQAQREQRTKVAAAKNRILRAVH